MLMENHKDIQAELTEISPELAGILPPKQPIAGQPSGYFEVFPEQMLHKAKETAVVDLRKPAPLIRLLKATAIAAAIAGIVFTAGKWYVDEPETVDVSKELAKISQAELEAYLITEETIDSVQTDIQKQLKLLDTKEISAYSINTFFEN